jgi:hypothetical protein
MCIKCLDKRIKAHINDLYYKGQKWLADEIKQPLHPAIMDAGTNAIELFCIGEGVCWHDSTRAMDYTQELANVLAAEYPHPALDDTANVSYTQCLDHGPIHRHTVCKLGRYINKHFPALPGDMVETLVVKYRNAKAMNFRIVTDQELTQAMIRSVAHSCMHSCDHNGTVRIWNEDTHPYKCYSSRLGWGMAIREDGNGEGKARSIVRLDEKKFIRIYGSDAAHSHTTIGDDPPLREWLIKQGFTTCRDFIGCKIERIKRRGKTDYLAPYIDGECKKAFLDKTDDHALLVDPKGNLSLQNTGGHTSILYELREGQTLCNDGTWCPDAEAQVTGEGETHRRQYCRFINRHQAWYHQANCIELNGVWEYRRDVCRVAKFNGDWESALRADCQEITHNGYRIFALSADLTADFKGDWYYTQDLIQLTGGAKKGQYALAIKTCTRDRDGAILLKQDAGHFKWHLTAAQWEPGLGDRVKLSEYGLNKYGTGLSNPSDCEGIIIQAYTSDQYYQVSWDNHTHNSYDENRTFELVETASQYQKRMAQEREAANV